MMSIKLSYAHCVSFPDPFVLLSPVVIRVDGSTGLKLLPLPLLALKVLEPPSTNPGRHQSIGSPES